MRGLVTRGIGGFYTVRLDDSSELVCKLRGRLRLDDDTVCVGDFVEIEPDSMNAGYGTVSTIYPRKNHLIRPCVSNVDQLAIILTASYPKSDLTLIDKLTFVCEAQGITPLLIINKDDINEPDCVEAIERDYMPTGYTLLRTSAVTGRGVDSLKKRLAGCVTCFLGQSGTGKSSLLNALMPELELLVGTISERSHRGRHTTRENKLLPLEGGGSVVDSPGFSLLDNIILEPHNLCRYYVEMRPALKWCRFSGCLHLKEPDCAVKALVSEGKLSAGRYERYVRMMDELIEKDKHKYDR